MFDEEIEGNCLLTVTINNLILDEKRTLSAPVELNNGGKDMVEILH